MDLPLKRNLSTAAVDTSPVRLVVYPGQVRGLPGQTETQVCVCTKSLIPSVTSHLGTQLGKGQSNECAKKTVLVKFHFYFIFVVLHWNAEFVLISFSSDSDPREEVKGQCLYLQTFCLSS